MAGESIVIIGAGMGGLSVGCYEQMTGYETQIFDVHGVYSKIISNK